MFGTHSQDEFAFALGEYVEGCQKIASDYAAKHYPKNIQDPWKIDWLQKRARVIHGPGVHSFVDFETGNVLKAAGWKVPAKHARGNIYDEHHGLKGMGPHGPAYLK